MSNFKLGPMAANEKRKILVTAGLPYANGDIHLGHLVEYLQADFWVRFQKMRGHECVYICADDTHGTPVMLKAQNLGITPEELIAGKQKDHEADFKDFEIEFSHYSSTNSDTNKRLSEEFYEKMKAHTVSKDIEQSYCEHDKMFLPDRFVRGTCPKCGAEDQYGDSCDNCGSTYAPTELIDAQCSICSNEPVLKESKHVFFKLNDFRDFLKEFIPDHNQPEVIKKLEEWLAEDLRDWNISRDEPYFGFEIPGKAGKYFYVWVDAPIGYISATAEYCEKQGSDYLDYWKSSDSEIYHFIGKDIVYFHSLFWTAMLKCADYSLPDQIFVHGFLTVNGKKMSKRDGTFIQARTYLKHLDPLYLRYYFASKLSGSVSDIDLNFQEFVERVNAELIGKITNLISRGAQMLNKKLNGKTTTIDADARSMLENAEAAAEEIVQYYENREFSKAMSKIRAVADEGNKYFDEKEPWNLIKTDKVKTQKVLTAIINLFRIIATCIKPVLPAYVQKVESLLNDEPYSLESIQSIHENKAINPYEHLAKRIDNKVIDAILENSKQN